MSDHTSQQNEHIDGAGRFKSDKYDWSPPDFFAMKLTDPAAQPHIWNYATVIFDHDPSLAEALKWRLTALGYSPPGNPFETLEPIDSNTPTGAAIARDHAIARFFNLAESMAREFESLTRDFAAAARQGFEDEHRRRSERRPGR